VLDLFCTTNRCGAMRRRGLGRVVSARASAGAVGVMLALLASGPPARGDVDRFDTVVIDAGHGGEDKGARGRRGLQEKDLVLDVALRLAAKLRDSGLDVVMTRDADTFVPLEGRFAVANDARGDLFVSIHANSAPDRDVRGTETFFLALRASDDEAEQVAERENAAFGAAGRAGAVSDDPLVAILADMTANEYQRESAVFAKAAQGHLASGDPHARGVKQALFVVLQGVQMPSALIEIGFLTHREEEEALRAGSGRDRVVDALSKAVIEYGRRYDERLGIDAATAPASGADR
jgi:N-acetylmuramoyl-L-alanine amidase